MNLKARIYIAIVMSAGLVCIACAAAGWNCPEPLHYICLLGMAMLASGLKVSLPGIPGTMSVSYVFVLLSMIDFSYPETVVVACMAIAVQSLYHTKKRIKVVQLLFNLASMAIAVAAGCAIAHRMRLRFHVTKERSPERKAKRNDPLLAALAF